MSSDITYKKPGPPRRFGAAINLRVDPTVKARLEAQADAAGLPLSDLIRALLGHDS